MDVTIGTYKCRMEIILLIIISCWILFGQLLCSCCVVPLNRVFKEGFNGVNINDPNFSESKNSGWIMNPNSWNQPSLIFKQGETPNAGVQAIFNRAPQPIPLPKDELLMFATTEFKPECCPNAYSSSSGCACMTVDQYTYLRERGSNNV